MDSEPWVVKQFGDGAVSFHSYNGPVVDPRDAHLKSEAAAREVASLSDAVARRIGMRCEAVSLREAIAQFEVVDEPTRNSVAFRFGRFLARKFKT
jgi:hypothetical protein